MKVLTIPVLLAILFHSSTLFYCWVSSWTPPLPPPPQHLHPHHAHVPCTLSTTSTAKLSSKTKLIPNSFRIRLPLQSHLQQTYKLQHMLLLSSNSYDNDGSDNQNINDDEPKDDSNNAGIDVSFDPRLYKVRLSRATGIDWGTDLSFAFVYVRGIDPTGAAALSGVVSINDQLCEVTPCISISRTTTDSTIESSNDNSTENENTIQPINLIGAPFDYVMQTFATLDRNVKELDFVFFRGSRDELKSICTGSTNLAGGDGSDMITVTVVENKGSSTEMIRQLRAPVGVNVRELLVNNNINVYQSITRWTNCKGKQLCGTCIVNIPTGGRYTNRKSMDEASTLRENPETYRLSCVLFAYGDITVETFPPINAAQWTR